MTHLLLSIGLTRDSAVLLWGKLLAVAALIASGTLDLCYWSAYVGAPLSTTHVHIVQVAAVVVLYLAGQYSTSPLPAKRP